MLRSEIEILRFLRFYVDNVSNPTENYIMIVVWSDSRQ